MIVLGSADLSLCAKAREVLEQAGFATCLRETAAEAAAAALEQSANGLLLDVRLDGCISACRWIRHNDPSGSTRLVILHDGEASRREADLFNAVADQFLAQPLAPNRVTITMCSPGASRRLSHADVELDPDEMRTWYRGALVELPKLEFAILALLLSRPRRVFSRREIIAGSWPRGPFVDPRTVNVHVGTLRRLLRLRYPGDPIRTVRGVGYGMAEAADEQPQSEVQPWEADP